MKIRVSTTRYEFRVESSARKWQWSLMKFLKMGSLIGLTHLANQDAMNCGKKLRMAWKRSNIRTSIYMSQSGPICTIKTLLSSTSGGDIAVLAARRYLTSLRQAKEAWTPDSVMQWTWDAGFGNIWGGVSAGSEVNASSIYNSFTTKQKHVANNHFLWLNVTLNFLLPSFYTPFRHTLKFLASLWKAHRICVCDNAFLVFVQP